MKSLILILFSFLFLAFTGDKKKSDLEKAHMNGKIKTTIESLYFTSHKTRRADSLVERTIDNYNENGNLINSSLYNGKGIYDGGDTIEYLNKKFFIKSREYNGAEITRIVISTCDSNWNVFRTLTYSGDSVLKDIDTLKYANNGLLTEEIDGYYSVTYPPDKILGSDNAGFEYRRDLITKYKYDDQGNDIEEDNYPNLIYTSKEKYKYDDKMNRTEVRAFESNGRFRAIYSFKYEDFDMEGNWQRRTRMHYNEFEGTTIRQIIYY